MNVFTVSKVLLMNVVESQMILNGNAGQVYATAPYIPLEAHPFDVFSLVAFCTAQKVYIMSLYQASVQMHCNVERPPSNSSIIPSLSWCITDTNKKSTYFYKYIYIYL